MFGVRVWHDADLELLDDAVWDGMKHAIRLRANEARKQAAANRR